MTITPATLRGAAAALLLFASPGVALAGIVRGTFAGVMSDGSDPNNIFGFGVNADLTGMTVAGDFYYDTSGGTVVGSDLSTSGPIYPPVVFAEVFIGGHPGAVYTYSDDNGEVNFPNNHTFTLAGDDIDSGFSDLVALDIGTGGAPFSGGGLDRRFDLSNPAVGSGTFFETIGDAFSGGLTTGGDFTITSATLGAPEPASVTLMATGLFAIALRRGRRR